MKTKGQTGSLWPKLYTESPSPSSPYPLPQTSVKDPVLKDPPLLVSTGLRAWVQDVRLWGHFRSHAQEAAPHNTLVIKFLPK